MKRTPWFLSKIKPIHKGLYEVLLDLNPDGCFTKLYWDGKRWCFTLGQKTPMNCQRWVWRGLIK